MKKALLTLLFFLMLAAVLVLVPSGSLAEDITPLPLEEDPGYGPKAECYLYEDGNPDPIGYEDPSISVSLSKGTWHETNYVCAKIKVADASQIRTRMAAQYGSQGTDPASKMAKRANAVIACNGDYYIKNRIGFMVRQGKQYRLNCTGDWDVLIIDGNGDLHILPNATNEDCEAFEGEIINAFTFGPGLVMDGVPNYGVVSNYIGSYKCCQRMCLAQTGKLEYLIITTEGPEDPGSKGLTIDEFVEFIMSFEGVYTAYNLDGGSSSSLIFKTAEEDYKKINSPQNSKVRFISDILYFASAWQGDAQ